MSARLYAVSETPLAFFVHPVVNDVRERPVAQCGTRAAARRWIAERKGVETDTYRLPAGDQELLNLRAASPKRAEPNRVVASQSDANHLPLFVAANEPTFL